MESFSLRNGKITIGDDDLLIQDDIRVVRISNIVVTIIFCILYGISLIIKPDTTQIILSTIGILLLLYLVGYKFGINLCIDSKISIHDISNLKVRQSFNSSTILLSFKSSSKTRIIRFLGTDAKKFVEKITPLLEK